jgi:hypothetical protein
MKFLNNSKELHSNALLKLLMLFLIGTLMLFLISDLLLHHYQIGLTISQAEETIMGNEENFSDPMLFDTLLEHLHIDILSSMITLMLLAVILIRLERETKQYTIHLSFLSAIFSHITFIASFYFSIAIPLWIGFFLLWHGVAFYMAINSMWRLSK